MRVLLDEMVSHKLERELTGHDVSTVQRESWAGLKNGALLDAIDSNFDVFITMDRGIRHQQQLRGRAFGIIEVRARSNAIRALLPIVPRLRGSIDTIKPGEIVGIDTVETSDSFTTPTPALTESASDSSTDG